MWPTGLHGPLACRLRYSFLNNLIFHLNRLKGGVYVLIVALIVALIAALITAII
jgi:hypothetical protein